MRKKSDPIIFDRGELSPKLPTSRVRTDRSLLRSLRGIGRKKGRHGATRRRHANAVGRAFSSGGRQFGQRVVVKARVVKQSRKGKGSLNNTKEALRKHVMYLSRSGTTIDGQDAHFFSRTATHTASEAKAQILRWADDEHHFRVIISPEHGSQLDMPSYMQSLMSKIESHLGTKLEWYAVNHFNTDNSHAHLLIRGVNDKGETLILGKDFISHGIRQMAEDEATHRLGLQQPLSVLEGLKRNLTELRPTRLDHLLLEEQAKDAENKLRIPKLAYDAREWEIEARANRLSRLHVLAEAGLATELESGIWSIREGCIATLQAHARNQKLRQFLEPNIPEDLRRLGLVLHSNRERIEAPIVGEVVARTLTDELSDSVGLVVSASDGHLHFVPLSRFSEPQGFPTAVGQVVSIETPQHSQKATEVMARFADASGVFVWDRFEKFVRSTPWRIPKDVSVDEYLDRFSKRLETLKRNDIVTDLGNGQLRFPKNLAERIQELDDKLGTFKHHKVTSLSVVPIEKAQSLVGQTYLDEILAGTREQPPIQTEFGARIRSALHERSMFLHRSNILREGDWLDNLRETEQHKLKTQLGAKLGPEIEREYGAIYRGTVHGYHVLGDGRYMSVKVDDGFLIRKLRDHEKKLEHGAPVTFGQRLDQKHTFEEMSSDGARRHGRKI